MAQRVVIPGFRKIETSGGGEGGTTNYNDLTNKPSINNVPLVGNLNTANLKLTDSTLTEEGVPAEAKTVGAKLAEQSSNLSSEISRAKETEETLKSRIDTITSLPEGSTTGDAELQDIRVKADGTTATSAGNAVREQFSELKGDLSKVEKQNSWWNPSDAFLYSLTDVKKKLVMNITKFKVTTHEKQTNVTLYKYVVNTDGSIDLAIRYNRDTDSRAVTFGITLPVSETYSEYNYSHTGIDLCIGYITETVSTQTTILTDWVAEEIINLRTIYTENPLTDNTGFEFVDNRLFSECTILNSNVGSIVCLRVQNFSSATYPYYAEYEVTYKDGTSNTFVSKNSLQNGFFVDTFDDFSVLVNVNVLTVYGDRLNGANIAFNKNAYIYDTKIRSLRILDKKTNDVFFDYDFQSLFGTEFSVSAKNGKFKEDKRHLFNENEKSYQLNGASDSTEIVFSLVHPIDLNGLQEIDVPIYIEDATKISSMNLHIVSNDTSIWINYVTGFKNGWNVKRFCIATKHARTLTNWDTANKISLLCNLTGTNVYVGDLILVKPQKAKLIFVEDHGYSNFKNVAYPRLKELGVPVTWAMKLSHLGKSVEYASTILNQSEIDELAIDGNSEFNLHSYRDQSITTVEELRAEELRGERWLKQQGLFIEPFWRSAVVQNNEPLFPQLKDLLKMNACYDGIDDRFDAFPFIDNHNIHRMLIHALASETIDAIFDTLKKTHCTVVVYTHDISDEVPETGGSMHMTNSQFDYFYSKLETAINEGWLEGTTVSRLYNRYFKGIELIN